MSIEETIAEVQNIFRDVLDDDDISIEYDTTAEDVDDWDSLNHIQLVVAIEKHFNIRFNASEIQGFGNVGEMCEGIINRS